MIVTSTDALSQAVPPNLPLAPLQYEPRYQDQLNNVLRLYFNQLNKTVGQLIASGEVIPPTTNYTVATLPSAVTSGAGARAFITDALGPAFGATAIGGGAVQSPVYSDGTNWKIG
jgi:hypothetical protein